MPRVLLPLLVSLPLLAGCAQAATGGPPGGGTAGGGTAGGGTAGTGGAGVGGAAGTRLPDETLQVVLDPGDGGPQQQVVLTCSGGGVEGTVPDPAGACAHLRSLEDPFAPLPGDLACTEQYGGPQTARVTGAWAGEPVDLLLSRVDGCAIAQWDSLAPLLPVEVGVDPPG